MGKSLLKRALVWAFLAGCLALGGWAIAGMLELHRPLRQADAIVIMAGSAAYRERVAVAVRLFAAGRAPLVVLTDEGTSAGWSEGEQRNPAFAELALKALVRGGVPLESIVVLPVPAPGSPTGTVGEARGIRRWTSARGVTSIIVVTSAYHSRRTAWTLDRVLDQDVVIGIEPAPFDERGSGWWSPRGWGIIAGEYVKWVYQVLSLRRGPETPGDQGGDLRWRVRSWEAGAQASPLAVGREASVAGEGTV